MSTSPGSHSLSRMCIVQLRFNICRTRSSPPLYKGDWFRKDNNSLDTRQPNETFATDYAVTGISQHNVFNQERARMLTPHHGACINCAKITCRCSCRAGGKEPYERYVRTGSMNKSPVEKEESILYGLSALLLHQVQQQPGTSRLRGYEGSFMHFLLTSLAEVCHGVSCIYDENEANLSVPNCLIGFAPFFNRPARRFLPNTRNRYLPTYAGTQVGS